MWRFARPGPIQRQRNSKLDEHFAGSGSDRSGDLVREGAQNAGDAKEGYSRPVRIRISFGELPASRTGCYAFGLTAHIPEIAKLKGMGNVKAVDVARPCKFLVFEDFGTTGLTGDPELERRYDGDEPNAFHTFFRAEGQTDKDDDLKQGSKGVGKITFMAASNARAVLGLTYRYDDKRTLLFGTAVLRTHRLDSQDYDGDAWFGCEVGEHVQPIEAEEIIKKFTEDFRLTRQQGQPGFSIVVPWLDMNEEDGVTPLHVIQAVLRDHAWPIFQKKLIVEVGDCANSVIVIDSASFLSVLTAQPSLAKTHIGPMAELAAWAVAHPPSRSTESLGLYEASPTWQDANLISPEHRDRLQGILNAGESVAVRVPVRIRPKERGSAERKSFFDIFLRFDPTAVGTTVQFVRGGLLVSGMSRRLRGVWALVVAEDEALAGFLRAAENPSHTKWNAKPIKDRFTYAPGTLNFVIDSVKHLSALLAGDPTEKDGTIWASELSLPTGAELMPGAGARGPSKRKRVKTAAVIPPLDPLPKKRPYDITVISGGFAVSPSGRSFPNGLPTRLELKLAYHVRGKNPLTNYSNQDFDLTEESSFPSTSVGCFVEVCEPNRLVIRIDDSNFAFSTTGFDVRRELFCRPRLETPKLSANEESVEDD
jgi:hypothetical protein